MKLPKGFITQMKHLLKDEWENFRGSYNASRHYGLRLNTLKATDHIIKEVIANPTKITWETNGYYYEETDKPTKHPYYWAGCYYIQEPSAMTPASALQVQPGDKVIDLCAAPGGKSTQIGSHLKNEGLLVSNDISSSRVKALTKNLQLAGITNCMVISENPTKLAGQWPQYFDKVIIDAPCSGEGMFRKDPKLIQAWEQDRPETFIPIQKELLSAAHHLLREGGELVYSTCTYNLDENEQNIKWLMKTHPHYDLINVPELLGIEPGYNLNAGLDLTGRVWPHKQKGEGHFVAKLRKRGNGQPVIQVQKGTIASDQLQMFLEFTDEIGYKLDAIKERLNVVNETLYLLPKVALKTTGLRVFANGWVLGTFKKDRFEPSQAFASGLLAHEVIRAVTLDLSDSVRYLKGETIPVEYGDGWCLVTVDGFSLGWGKVVKGRLKNKLEPTWRWQ